MREEHWKSRGKPAYQMSPEKEREHRRTRGDRQAGPAETCVGLLTHGGFMPEVSLLSLSVETQNLVFLL
jgi:hypothetical protein